MLRIGAIPDQNPEKLNRLYGLVADELGGQLSVKVIYVPVTDYAAAVSAFRTGNLDVVWFGGLTGVQASLQKPGAQMIAQRDIDAQFYSVFIANARSGLKPIQTQKGLTVLKGKRFTFGSESSTSGRLMPQYFLSQAGVKLADFAGGAPGFSGSHDATIALVQSGTYDAGAVNEQVWKSSLRSGKANRSKVVQIWRTPSYPDYLWLGQPNLDQRFGNRAGMRHVLNDQHRNDGRCAHDGFNGCQIPCSLQKAAAAPNRPGWGWVISLTGIRAIMASKRPLARNRSAKPEVRRTSLIRRPRPPAITTADAPCVSAISPATLPSDRQKRSIAAVARLSSPDMPSAHRALSSNCWIARPSIRASV